MALLSAGTLLQGRYRIAKLLAQGGFGTLYRAWDTVLGRACALKENLDPAPEVQRQFLREAKLLAGLSHPNLPRVSDYFAIPGQGQYLVMDLIEGKDLQEMLDERGGPLPEGEVLPWIGQVCDALAYLHAQKPPVIHRDIKPANIKITPQGQAMLIDFGIAKVYDPGSKTTVGAQAVTPGFSPYEQYGKGQTDARTDLYALGATLYTLLTGQEPPESVQRVVRDPLAPPRQLNPALSLRTSGAIVRALQIDPTQRFQSAADFKAALAAPVAARSPAPAPAVLGRAAPPPAAPVAAGPPTARSLPWLWIGLVAVLSLVILGLTVALLRRPAPAQLPGSPAPALSEAAGLPGDVTPTTALSATSAAPLAGGVSLTPSASLSATPAITPYAYVVQVGDTCSGIAHDYGVPMQRITELNNLPPDCAILYAGQTLLIPIESSGVLATAAARRTATALPPQVTRIAPGDGMLQLYVPAGEFLMGSTDADADARQDEKPQRSVYASAFWIDRHEVTNGMYARCIQAGTCRPPASSGSKTRPAYFDDPAYENYPVIYVSWDDAAAYCQWAGRRLPSEAEWEKAARGADGRLYPWGDEPPSPGLANYNRLMGDTQPVGSYLQGASPYGVWDLSGNVAEWVADWYGADYYAGATLRNPPGPALGQFRVLRGGSWLNAAHAIRAAFRLWNTADVRSDSIGFRCAR